MRIMDRSSDVCSTDLVCRQAQRLVRTTQHHLKKAGRKSSLLEQLGDLEGNSGPFWRRLHDDGIARDQGRRHLLHQEIGPRIARRASRDDSIRNALGNSIASSEERRVGKSVSVRVDIGGRRSYKKKRHTTTQTL